MNLLEAVLYGKGTLSKKKIMPIANVGKSLAIRDLPPDELSVDIYRSGEQGVSSSAHICKHKGGGGKERKKNTQVHVSWSSAKRLLSPQSSVFRGKKNKSRNLLPNRETQKVTATAYLLLLLSFVVDKNGRTECPPSYLLHDFILLHPGLHSPFCIRSFAAVGSTTTVRALLSTLLGCHQKHLESGYFSSSVYLFDFFASSGTLLHSCAAVHN